ncbi:MAG: hypothetical protein V1888_00410 [archaeon]
MQLKQRVIYSIITSTVVLITAIFIPIIPCRTAPGVPNPIYKWALCSLNPDKISLFGSITEYFGYTTSLRDAYILTLFIIFVAAIIFLHYAAKTKKSKRR